jgi:hypothetical protein
VLTEERKWISENKKLVENAHYSPHQTLFACGQLSISTAIEPFNDFFYHVLPSYSGSLSTSKKNFSSYKKHQPTLLLAVITAACGVSDPSPLRKLHSYLRADHSEQAMVQGNQSLELV